MRKYLYPADILLPKSDFERWAVIACDQYTSDKNYWEQVEKKVGDNPSTLRLILPEIYLNQGEQLIESINNNMNKYISDGVFYTVSDSMIYIEREITGGGIRKGILGLIDLEEYEYEQGKDALIRATEQTVAERIPPRVKIRKDALLEFPHLLLFIDDPEDKVMRVVSEQKDRLEKLYDFNLMQKGGHIEGYRIEKNEQDSINTQLEGLIKDGFLFAVGDGNHSLATAKECYKLKGNRLSRYALVEIVNIHNPAIEFEPIYRVLFGTTRESITAFIQERNQCANSHKTHTFTVIDNKSESELEITATSNLPVGTLQSHIDAFLQENPDVSVDYIHGTESVRELCKEENTVGFIFNGMEKNELFDSVIKDGSLPRKTFSMGHADDKRFYIEGRKIL